MRDFVCFIVLAVAIPISAAQAQQAAAPPSNSIDPPAGEKLLLELHGDGVQIYTCTFEQGAAGWKFQGPEAKLTDKEGKPAGTHFAGPTWKMLDGSEVKGSMVGTKPATEPGAVGCGGLAAAEGR
jgi:Protein of unknown function (DUF3455)